MLLKEYIRLALTLPPKVVAQKAAALLRRELHGQVDSWKSRKRTTYGEYSIPPGPQSYLSPHFPSPSTDELLPHKEQILYLAKRACSHEFNLLGSGWVKVEYGMRCKGLEGYLYDMPPPSLPDQSQDWLQEHLNAANASEACKRYQLIKQPYIPIDWQLDFKSGYRWSASTRNHAIRYGEHLGADVKVPWELARMQHLPQLAWAYQLATAETEGFESPEIYLTEFQNQVLDFIAMNPPKFGVNWVCTMDVAIRVSNWLITWNFFVNSGASFDRGFESVFICNVHDHGHYIINNLEWSESLRSNHYLADIAGLLFVAAYLPETEESNAWLSLSINELGRETPLQFNADGSNFEASTCYHRLSAEMLLYSTALALTLPEARRAKLNSWKREQLGYRGFSPIPPCSISGHSILATNHCNLLEKIAQFTKALTLPDGNIAQIGDNDSGRFLKLQVFPSSTTITHNSTERSLDHSHLLAAYDGYLSGESWDEALTNHIEFYLMSGICNSKSPSLPPPHRSHHQFPNFGAYVWISPDLHFIFRCGDVGQNGNGGHAHNDQLSFVAAFKGEVFFVDPGTYLYTPLPDKRNQFRSTRSHNSILMDSEEQNSWIDGRHGLFNLSRISETDVIQIDSASVLAKCSNSRSSHTRFIQFGESVIEARDELTSPDGRLLFHLEPSVIIAANARDGYVELSKGSAAIILSVIGASHEILDYQFSDGYGETQRGKCLQFKLTSREVRWQIRVSQI